MSLLNLSKAYAKKLEKKTEEKEDFSALKFFKTKDQNDKLLGNSFDLDNLRLWKSFDESYNLINLEVKDLEIDLSEILKGL